MVLAPRRSSDSVRVQDAARAAGVDVLRLDGWRVPPELGSRADGLYAEPPYADVVAGPLGLALLEAPLDWLVRCPAALRGRPVEPTTLAEARARLAGPAFVKAQDDKSVPPAVYRRGAELPGQDRVDGATPVLVQGVLRLRVEYRFWCLSGAVLTGSRYAVDGGPAPHALGGGEAASARAYAQEALSATRETLPDATVLDVGVDDEGRWVVVEVNAAWGSGLYASDEHAALPVVRASVLRADRVPAPQAPFVRELPQVSW